MELNDDPPAARWADPLVAFGRFQPGLSPYLHYLQELRKKREGNPPDTPDEPGDSANVPRQLEQALRNLIRQSFE